MQEQEATIFLNGLRGAQPIIVLAYLVVRRAMTMRELRTYTGLSDDFLRPALDSLVGKQLLCKQVGEHGRATWLPVGDSFFGRIMSQNPLTADSGATTTTVKLTDQKNKLKLTAVAANAASQNPLPADSVSDEKQKAIWRICKKIGIGEPTRTRIALETDYPPEYIWAHGLYGASEGLAIGLIIHRIRSHDWLPEHWKETARGSVEQFYIEDALSDRD